MIPICTACARNEFGLMDPGPCPPPGGEWKWCGRCDEQTYWGLTVEDVKRMTTPGDTQYVPRTVAYPTD